MGIWDNVKKSGTKTKIRGEMMLLEREASARKKLFGIEFYDLITNDKNKLLGVSAGTIFKGQRAELQEPFERAKDDIAGKQALKEDRQKSLDVLEVKGAHTLPDQTMGQKVRKGGAHLSNAATATNLAGRMAWIDREIKIRKEEFGIEVFSYFTESASGGGEDGGDKRTSLKKKLSQSLGNSLSSVTQHEKDIQACIDSAIKDVAAIEDKIKSKQRQMGLVDSETEPLTSS